MINQIQDDTGAEITIEDDGTIYIGADRRPVGRGGARRRSTRSPTRTMPEVGERYLGTVVKTTDVRRVRLAAARARTACCTSRSSASSPAASGSRTSRTSSRSATRSRSRSPRSTPAASSRWSRSSRTSDGGRRDGRRRADARGRRVAPTPSRRADARSAAEQRAGSHPHAARRRGRRRHRPPHRPARRAAGRHRDDARRALGDVRRLGRRRLARRDRRRWPAASHYLEHLLFKGTRAAHRAGHLRRRSTRSAAR